MHYGHKSEFFGYQTEYLIYIWVFIKMNYNLHNLV